MVRVYVKFNPEWEAEAIINREFLLANKGHCLERYRMFDIARDKHHQFSVFEEEWCYIARNFDRLEDLRIRTIELSGKEVMSAAEFFAKSPSINCPLGVHYFYVLMKSINEELEDRKK